jgi:[ribosomal protein S5]-alanine N-acetyltransferase
LKTERLVLEPLKRRHARRLFAALQEPELWTHIPQEPPKSVAALEARYRKLERRTSADGKDRWLNWAVRLPRGPYVGLVEATILYSGEALLAWMTFGPHQRRGYAREACSRVIASLLSRRHVERVSCSVDVRNRPSLALARALGFVRVGKVRGADRFKGRVSDEFKFRIVRP